MTTLNYAGCTITANWPEGVNIAEKLLPKTQEEKLLFELWFLQVFAFTYASNRAEPTPAPSTQRQATECLIASLRPEWANISTTQLTDSSTFFNIYKVGNNQPKKCRELSCTGTNVLTLKNPYPIYVEVHKPISTLNTTRISSALKLSFKDVNQASCHLIAGLMLHVCSVTDLAKDEIFMSLVEPNNFKNGVHSLLHIRA